MKQILQNYRTGELKIEEVPPPALRRGGVLVRTAYSLISAGTERDTLRIARKSLVGKAQSRPDLVQKVVDTVKKEGLARTYRIVTDRLNDPVPLGYSLAGKVIEAAPDVEGLAVGDLVACAGAGHANHAEVVFVPKHLCAVVPAEVNPKQAAFSTLGAIALHAVRQASVSVGDRVGIIGLGLLGLITTQICKASGCGVLGIDLAEGPVRTALELGADEALTRGDPELDRRIARFTRDRGLDRVIIAAGTDSKDPFLFAGEILRDRGLLVILGGVRMEVVRTISSRFYEREIEIRLARSYGPGRYDPVYEVKGVDYPIGYVRWTEQRNLACFLDLVAGGRVRVDSLITHVVPIGQAQRAYELIQDGTSGAIGVLLSYDHTPDHPELPARDTLPTVRMAREERIGVGMIGAGNFARSNLLPHLEKNRSVRLVSLMTAGGTRAQQTARRFGFDRCTSSAGEITADPACSLIVVATRHDSHADYVRMALEQGKIVYVEKPLAISMEQLRNVWTALRASPPARLMVGYNRRFAPLVQTLKGFFRGTASPLTVLVRVNAGYIPPDHWYQDPDQGGRIVGEGCHFVDLCQYLCDAEPTEVHCSGAQDRQKSLQNQDSVTLTIRFSNGASGVVHYLSEGDPGLPKERVEVFGGGACAVLDDFRELALYRNRKKKAVRSKRLDKGHGTEMEELIRFAREGGNSPIPERDLFLTTLATLRAVDSLRTGLPQTVSLADLERDDPG